MKNKCFIFIIVLVLFVVSCDPLIFFDVGSAILARNNTGERKLIELTNIYDAQVYKTDKDMYEGSTFGHSRRKNGIGDLTVLIGPHELQSWATQRCHPKRLVYHDA